MFVVNTNSLASTFLLIMSLHLKVGSDVYDICKPLGEITFSYYTKPPLVLNLPEDEPEDNGSNTNQEGQNPQEGGPSEQGGEQHRPSGGQQPQNQPQGQHPAEAQNEQPTSDGQEDNPQSEQKPASRIGGYLFDVLLSSLKICCGDNANPGKKDRVQYTLLVFLGEADLESSLTDEDFIMPVILHKGLLHVFDALPGFNFVPIISSPGLIILQAKDKKSHEVWDTLLQAWPLLLLVMFACGLAGILIWAVDRVYNPDEFLKSFRKGFGEGIWWAFVTMTTVGYGDKTPRSPPGRCFGIIWITVGIILMSVLTATLAAAFVEQEAPFGDITDKNIAFVRNSIEEMTVLTRSANPYNYSHHTEMLESLAINTDLDGGLLDYFAYDFFGTEIEELNLMVVGEIREPSVVGYIFNGVDGNATACLVKTIAAQRSTLTKLTERTKGNGRGRHQSPAARKSRSVFSQTLFAVYITGGLFLLALLIAVLWEFLFWRPKFNQNQVLNISLNSKTILHDGLEKKH